MSISKVHLESMISYCFDFAKGMLVETGEFAPFGVVALSNGQLRPTMIDTSGSDLDSAMEIMQYDQVFSSEVRNQNVVGCALATNVDIPLAYEPQYPDGIKVRYETNSACDQIYLPYLLVRNGVSKKQIEIRTSDHFYVTTKAKWFKQHDT